MVGEAGRQKASAYLMTCSRPSHSPDFFRILLTACGGKQRGAKQWVWGRGHGHQRQHAGLACQQAAGCHRHLATARLQCS